jgi:hypothetical protein
VLGRLEAPRLRLSAIRCSPEGFAALCAHASVEELELAECARLAECDLGALRHLRRLRRLGLVSVGERTGQRPAIDAVVMAALATLPALEELDLHGSALDAAAIAALPPQLRRLNLCGCRIGDAAKLDAVKLPRLEALSCGGNSPRTDAALIDRQPLKFLHFEGAITDAIAASLARQTGLQEFEFVHRGHQDGADLAPLKAMRDLRVLRLTNGDGCDPAPLRDLAALSRVELAQCKAACVERWRTVLGARVTVVGREIRTE